MGRVSLILPVASAGVVQSAKVDPWRAGLEQAGYSVEILVVLDSATHGVERPGADASNWIVAEADGLAVASVAGLRAAAGDYLIVLDPRHDVDPDDLANMLKTLVEKKADVVVARRMPPSGWIARGLGWMSKRVIGSSDPFSGVVAMTPATALQLVGTFEPVGSRFTIDVLFRANGCKVEVPVRAELVNPTPIGINDLRHFKRLCDDTFGTISRLVQFCAVGASGMIVDLSAYALFQLIFSTTSLSRMTAPWLGGPLDLAVAGALSISIALVWNFSLNRRLTFNDARAGSIPRQFLAYVLSNALGVALSFSIRLYLPAHVAFFSNHRLAAAVVGIVMATGISFSMARWLVFSQRGNARGEKPRKLGSADYSKRRGRPEGSALLGTIPLKADQ